MLKIYYYFFARQNPANHCWAGLDSAQDQWAQPTPAGYCEWAHPAWRGKKQKQEGRRVYLEKPWSLVIASGGGGSRRRRCWWQLLLLFFLLPFSLFFLLIFVFLLSFSICFFFLSFSPPLFSLLSSFSLLSALTSALFVSPVFIGKNRGDIWKGRPLCSRHMTARGGTSPQFLQHVGGHGSA